MHLIRALAKVHPTWTFAGLSAACVYQYEHSYSLHNGTVDIVLCFVKFLWAVSAFLLVRLSGCF